MTDVRLKKTPITNPATQQTTANHATARHGAFWGRRAGTAGPAGPAGLAPGFVLDSSFLDNTATYVFTHRSHNSKTVRSQGP